ncbi:hypothetical protein ACFL2Z_04035 [Candidatus Eisenbacteria bacterium]|uniref:Secreted protein n=1 Tax=Eiseniibacteriota bacterium TaxID=2212470 RepID=A0ABV6YPR9_UNCEI
MDKLSFDMTGFFTVSLVVIGLALSAAILPETLSATESDLSGDGDASSGGKAAFGDLNWVSQLSDDAHRLSQKDGTPRGKVLEELRGHWTATLARWQNDSQRTGYALIESLFVLQIDHVTSILNDSAPQQDAPGDAPGTRLDEAVLAIEQLSSLSPLVQAARNSNRSSLLVVSSVGCACELRRCSRMTELYATMRSSATVGPIAVVDLMQVPPLEDLLGQITGPYWILFNEDGDAATIIEMASNAGDVRASVVSWLDESKQGLSKE